ncbi:hypothetical protein K438DRAFT_245972 [Mycena galopus ATCC 62051]|nr:hypothetical protein K438DRAFT_245972 [Mycena galopus ATCC 62051]
MDAERTSLIAETYYLGVADIRDEVVWRNIDGEHKMVTRESADAEDLHIATTSVTASESLLVPAELTFVALLSSKDFWLSSDGHWTGPIQHIKNLAEVKLKCSAVAPSWSEVPVFAGDFTDVLQNMHWLMDSAGTAGITQKGIFPSEPSPAESSPAASSPQASLALRHVLFDKVYGSPGKSSD